MWRNIGILANLQRQTPSQEVKFQGSSLMVQWLWLCTPNAGGPDLIPGQGTRSHMPQLRPSTAKLIFLKSQVWIFCLKIDPRKPGRILGKETGKMKEAREGCTSCRLLLWAAGAWSRGNMKNKPQSYHPQRACIHCNVYLPTAIRSGLKAASDG